MPDATPMFQSKAHLQGRLRLSAIVQNGDADEQLDGAIREARLWLWNQVGPTRLAELFALPVEDPPSTNDGMVRKVAEEVEYLRVRWTLLELYSTQYKEGSAFFQEWNDEAFRSGAIAVGAARREITKQLSTYLDTLKTPNPGSVGLVQAETYEPDTATYTWDIIDAQ